jgi:hypothetical protein
MQLEAEMGLGAEADRLLAAIPVALRPTARTLLADPRLGGRGLRAWLGLLAVGHGPLPAALPAELVEVYLRDAEAEPLHDCEACGLPVPVRAAWRAGHEPAADRVYFPACPQCGGRTGPHAYWGRATAARVN